MYMGDQLGNYIEESQERIFFTKVGEMNFSKQVRSVMPNIPDISKIRPNKSIGLYYKGGGDSS